MNASTDLSCDLMTPEFKLVAHCCLHPETEQTRRAIADLASVKIDWREISRLAARHRVQGFVQDRLARIDQAPKKLQEQYSKEARKRALVNLRQANETGRLHRLLIAHGIPNLVFKGLPLAVQLYGSLTLKRSADIDLLVEPAHAFDAVQLLAQQGFFEVGTGKTLTRRQIEGVKRHFKEITLSNGEGVIIDLHWKLIKSPHLLTGLDPFRDAQRITIENIGEIAVLGEADQFAYLCAHGAMSDWFRLKWLGDVYTLIRQYDAHQLMDLYAHAEKLGCGTCVLQALVLCSNIWKHPIPKQLKTKIEAIGREKLQSYPLHRMNDPLDRSNLRTSVRRIREQIRIRSVLYDDPARARNELKAHFRAVQDILTIPLPAGLDWLYVLMRPFFWAKRKIRR